MPDFYDDLAPLYHLIYDDWNASIERQGRQLSAIIHAEWPVLRTVLDVSCGIGTQSIALAKNGFRVKASDLSAKAAERAATEAKQRNQDIAFSVCDMRSAHRHHGGGFDLVVSCDNSIPHLLTDEDISLALHEMYACLRAGGGCLITVRDYDQEPRGTNIIKQYGARVENGKRYIAFQVWEFDGACYDMTLFMIEEYISTKKVTTRAMRSRIYAICTETLLTLMTRAGFINVKRLDNVFYQPVLIGTKPA
jgi:SAM-dependent methyltransferase